MRVFVIGSSGGVFCPSKSCIANRYRYGAPVALSLHFPSPFGKGATPPGLFGTSHPRLPSPLFWHRTVHCTANVSFNFRPPCFLITPSGGNRILFFLGIFTSLPPVSDRNVVGTFLVVDPPGYKFPLSFSVPTRHFLDLLAAGMWFQVQRSMIFSAINLTRRRAPRTHSP